MFHEVVHNLRVIHENAANDGTKPGKTGGTGVTAGRPDNGTDDKYSAAGPEEAGHEILGKKTGVIARPYFVLKVFLALAIIGGLAVSGYCYRFDIKEGFLPRPRDIVKCPPDGKMCPGGRIVYRLPPYCNFEDCPPLASEGYYEELQVKCRDDSCCLLSLDRMRWGSFQECGVDRVCQDGYRCNALNCGTSLRWCEPASPGSISADSGSQEE